MSASPDASDLPLFVAERAARSASTGRLILFPGWRDRRLVERLANAYRHLPAGEDVEDFRARYFAPLADARRAVGFSEEEIASEIVWLKDAVAQIVTGQGEHDDEGGRVA